MNIQSQQYYDYLSYIIAYIKSTHLFARKKATVLQR